VTCSHPGQALEALWKQCGMSLYVLCRFTLGELEDFLEAAKEAIPGVREAIDAALSHKAHQVRQHFLWHLAMQSYPTLRRLHAGSI
jgi:hypothetical protein